MATKKATKKVEEKVEKVVNSKLAELIEKYKVQNPAKYELKKAELEAKLNK